MSSQYPSNNQKQDGFRKSIRSRAKRLKNVLRDSSGGRLTPENSEYLAAPSVGSRTPSISRPATPLVAPASPPKPGSDRRLTPPVGPSTQAPVPEAEVYAITENTKPVPGVGFQTLSHSGFTTHLLASAPCVDSMLEQELRPTTPPPEPSTENSDLCTKTKTAQEIKKSSNIAWTRMIGSLRILETSVEVFPPLKSAVGAFIGCLNIVQKAASNCEDYEKLADEFQSMAHMLQQYASDLESEPSNGSIANIAQCIQRQVTEIEKREASGTLGRLLNATQDRENVIRHYRQVERLFRQLQCELTMRTRGDVKKHFEMTLLQRMSPVDDAKYNSSYSNIIRRHRCTAETREAIHRALQDWTMDPKSEKIYWMNGMAGTGKTTIAYSYCEWLERTNRLGASFFCSRISSTCRSLTQIVPTLAYQLARFSPAFRAKLCTTLNDDPDAGKLNVSQQFEKLLYRPMSDAQKAIPDSVVIVIDALDECDDNYSVRLLLNVLLKFAEQVPLKFFVASRPEPLIRDRMMSQGGSSRFIVYLHDIEQSIVEEDIKKYFIEAFSPMEPPPSLAQIQLLAKRSRNLFIYAATVVRYIYPDDVPVDSSARLELMLEAIGSARTRSSNRYEDLDLLYTTVLGAVFQKRLEEGEKDYMQRVLWTVVCAREPVITDTIASLSKLTKRQVWSALQPIRSVVHIPENSNLISTLHASFPEYMLDESRSKGFCCSESRSNETMVHRCFDVMKSELKFNICELDSSYLTDDQVDGLEARVTRCISPTLSYACRYWASHLQLTPPSNDTRDMVIDFLSNRLLFWMEVLSLSRCIGIGAPMMQQAQIWLRQILRNRDEIQKQVSDARNFITWFAANPCSRSTPHIYISALPLCAKSSWVYQHYFQRTSGLANIWTSQHEEAVLAIWNLESSALSVAISPEGDRIASASSDSSVWVYDMHTGAVAAGPFQGHTRQVNSVAFSPDGRYIASGSDDCTVIIWDVHTGRIVTGPLHKYANRVWSVAFSPDGRRVVSGSRSDTFIEWNTFTGAVVAPLKPYSDRIHSVAFSPDGHLIAWCSSAMTNRLCDVPTEAAVNRPFMGHGVALVIITLSPDGTRLASCSSDGTVRLWDKKISTIIGFPVEGCNSGIYTLGFSHNGRWVASVGHGDVDKTNIIVWDILTGSIVLGPLSGHTQNVSSVTFTMDDTRIVSCSLDRTIRIWDVEPKAKASGQKGAYKHSVGPIAFLRNFTQFIAVSSTSTLQIWDLCTGTTIQLEFEVRADVTNLKLYSITVSPQQTLVAVAVNDLTIRLWNILTGKLLYRPLKGHKGLAQCLAFSPDGTRLCSGSDDTTIIVWDVAADAMASQLYEGHTGAVTSVAFLPNANYIASGSNDRTVRIWDSSTGMLVHTLDGHNTLVSSIALSPDGSRIISGSIDGTIRTWEARTGNCLNTLFEPETSSYMSCSSDRSTPVHWVCFSPDGAYIASAFGSSVWLLNSQNTDMVSRLDFPSDEQVHWVGYAPNGSDIVTASAQTEVATNESTQASTQSPNIIRVWRTAFVVQPNQQASSSTPRTWSYEADGRILSPEGLVMWIPADLIPYMGEHTTFGSESYYSSVVWSPDRYINIGYPNLHIGKRWTECYVSNH